MDGKNDETEISQKLSQKYINLYTSVGYTNRDMGGLASSPCLSWWRRWMSGGGGKGWGQLSRPLLSPLPPPIHRRHQTPVEILKYQFKIQINIYLRRRL